MKVIRADSAGFCWGVERAIDIARKFAEGGKTPVFTDGPLIHNRQMMERLHNERIREVGDYQSQSAIEFAPEEKQEAVMVVRAHGISPERRKYLKSLGLKFRDATCPDVGFIAGKIRRHASKGYSTVIFGDPKHPEAIGLMGYTDGRGYVVQSTEDIDALPDLGENVIFVSQSTMFTHEFEELALYLRNRYEKLIVIDTICQATKDRQGDIPKLIEQGAEAIVVIGGHHSANTKKLAKLAQSHGQPTYHIETADEIDPTEFAQYGTVGVTAGASTPRFLIDAVCEKLKNLDLAEAAAN
ncbi:MAG: 4-hydroxy-3-methylbut-2-enyl diphosphate reductase [Verrucomicrobiota bacterium]